MHALDDRMVPLVEAVDRGLLDGLGPLFARVELEKIGWLVGWEFCFPPSELARLTREATS